MFVMSGSYKGKFTLQLDATYLSPWIQYHTCCNSYHSINTNNNSINLNKYKYIKRNRYEI